MTVNRKSYTVKQLARIAGVSVRTLHYYDEIGLLAPTTIGENNYRQYGTEAILRLQQILFFRELDFSLNEIRDMLDKPDFDRLAALELQREALATRITRIQRMIGTIDNTMRYLKGEIVMDSEELFEGFDPVKQAAYEEEIKEKYGQSDAYAQSQRNWGSKSTAQKKAVLAEAGEIYRDLIPHLGGDPGAPAVQAIIARWHQNMRNFYEPTPEIMRGLAQGYAEHPDFIATFTAIHPDLPPFLRRAVEIYADSVAN